MKSKTNGLVPFSLEEEQKIIRDCVKAANNIDTLTDKAYRFMNVICSKRTSTTRSAIALKTTSNTAPGGVNRRSQFTSEVLPTAKLHTYY